MKTTKHICLIVDCLSGGGAEKVAATFSFALQEQGYKVSILSVRDQITYKYAGDLYNIGKNESSVKRIKQLKKILLFRRYYKEISADFYVDFRMRNRFLMESLLHLFVFNSKKMIMSIQNYNINFHMPKNVVFRYVYNNTKAIIAVSKTIESDLKLYYSFKNVYYIPNFVNKKRLSISKLPLRDNAISYILAIGRLQNEIKQFDKLILSYKNTELCKNKVPLVILGDGKDKAVLQKIIDSNNLQDIVKLKGFVSNPYDYIKQCKFLVLCSKVEGLPLVILESLAIGTPVVSFDCPSGPSELITHKFNGLLVEDQNFKLLEKYLDLLNNDAELYEALKLNAKHSIKQYTEQMVIKSWLQLFN